MTALKNALVDWLRSAWGHWDQFWFTPIDAATLGLIRFLTGAMLLYTHLVWTFDLDAFFGRNAWLSTDFAYRFHDSAFAWSHLYWIESPFVLWVTHLMALVVFASLMVGYQSRIAAILSFLLTVSYAHRATGALFGLDQINGFLALYLICGPCGNAFSVDQWLRSRRHEVPAPSISANVAIRLMQLHLCVVYLFAGCGKLLGDSWWQGTALWGAFANHEYQTLDMTWLAGSIVLVNLLTHITLGWEVAYAALIWPKLTRPVMLLLAIPLHLGIAVCMGMVTFGVIMLVANLSFVSPALVRRVASRFDAASRLDKVSAEAEPSRSGPPKSKQRRKSRTGNISY